MIKRNKNIENISSDMLQMAQEVRKIGRNEWEKSKEKGNEMWHRVGNEFDGGEKKIQEERHEFKTDV